MMGPYGMFGYRDDKSGFVKADVDKESAKITAAEEALLYFQLIPTGGRHGHLAYKRRPDGGYTTVDWSTRRGVFSNLLTICKPRIRSAARVGDWVAALTAGGWPEGPGLLVYAMRVTTKMTMGEYDDWTRRELPQ